MTYGYIRVSSDKQTVENQRFEIEQFALREGLVIDDWVEETISGTKNYDKREFGKLLEMVSKDDLIICTEISRLGRTLFMIMEILNICMTKECRVWTIKDNFRLGDDISSKVLAFAFGLAAEIERNLISQRTKEALKAKRAAGVRLGRPKGKRSKTTKLTGREDEIRQLMEEGLPIKMISEKLGVHRGTLSKYMHDVGYITEDRPYVPAFHRGFNKDSILEPYTEEIKALAKNGATRAEIAEKYGVCIETISKFIRSKGIICQKPPIRLKLDPYETEVRLLVSVNVSKKIICKKYGVSKETLNSFLKKRGISYNGYEIQSMIAEVLECEATP